MGLRCRFSVQQWLVSCSSAANCTASCYQPFWHQKVGHIRFLRLSRLVGPGSLKPITCLSYRTKIAEGSATLGPNKKSRTTESSVDSSKSADVSTGRHHHHVAVGPRRPGGTAGHRTGDLGGSKASVKRKLDDRDAQAIWLDLHSRRSVADGVRDMDVDEEDSSWKPLPKRQPRRRNN